MMATTTEELILQNGSTTPQVIVMDNTSESTHDRSTFKPAVITRGPFCQWILAEDIGDSSYELNQLKECLMPMICRNTAFVHKIQITLLTNHSHFGHNDLQVSQILRIIRLWDLIIFIPNCIFLLFLIVYVRSAISKLRASSSPIFTAFFGLVVAVSITSVLRCVVSMSVNASTESGNDADKILWLLLRFFLLATEMSVVIFGLAFGHLDSRTSIQRVLLVTFSIALIYSGIQGVLEFEYDHPAFKSSGNSTQQSYDLFAHGGMIFLFTSSFLYSLVYVVILILPFTRLRERYQLPTKKLFYYYCTFLAALNITQSVGAVMLYKEYLLSLCVIDGTTYLYFSFFNPLVYCVFLWRFFWSKDNNVEFSYKHQEDLIDDDQVSLPYSGTYAKPDDISPIFSYDSTHLDVHFRQGGHSSYSGSDVPATMSINSDNYVPPPS